METKTINGLIREWSGIGRDDFDHDLNAMWQAEERINETPSLGYTYNIALTELARAYEDGVCNHMRLYHATAAQRAEALLRTIGKWKDETTH